MLIGDHKQLPAVVQQTEAESRVTEPELMSIGPVSYTHLDVYKRQTKDGVLTFWLYGDGSNNSVSAA